MEGSGFGSICLWFFLFLYQIFREPPNGFFAKFTQTCLVPGLDNFEGQRSRSPGTKKRHFSALSTTCMRLMFRKTSLASSFLLHLPLTVQQL